MAEYAILDQLLESAQNNRERFMEKHPEDTRTPALEKVNESWDGSSPTISFYVFKNYFTKNTGVLDLAIVIHEQPSNGKLFNDFKINNCETAIFPLYNTTDDAFEIPAIAYPLKLTQEQEDFIREKRKLPKKPYGEGEFDPLKHRWSTDKIAEELGISNRTVGKYIRSRGL